MTVENTQEETLLLIEDQLSRLPLIAPGDEGEAEGSTTPASEGGSATGQPDEGDGGGTQPVDAQALQAERDRLDQLARTHQARADRAEAELKRLQAAGTSKPEAGSEPSVSELFQQFERRQELKARLTELRAQFPLAQESVLHASYDSPEAMFIALSESHAAVKALVDKEVSAREAAIREEFDKRSGGGSTPAGANGNTGATGEPSWQELNAMGIEQLDELDARLGPGYVDRRIKAGK